MKTFQAFNGRTKSWVKGSVVEKKDGGKFFKVTDVKQREPTKPFKNVPFKK